MSGVREPVTIRGLVAAASRITGIEQRSITGPLRFADLVRVRAAIAVAARMLAENPNDGGRFSWPSVGRGLGSRDHSTVMNLVRRWPKYCADDADLAALPQAILHACRGGGIAPTQDAGAAIKTQIADLERRIARQEVLKMRAKRKRTASEIAAAVHTDKASKVTTQAKAKNDFTTSEDADSAHVFHANIAAANDPFIAALKAARLGVKLNEGITA